MRLHATCLAATALLLSCTTSDLAAGVRPLATGAFAVEFDVTYSGSPEAIYDGITGDISAWWDHSFSGHPLRIYIEPKPGGGFFEIFNEAGDGVLHATVIYAHRGKILRFEGPLGLAGRAIQNVVTYTFEKAGEDSTRLRLEVHMQGEIDERMAGVVEQVWRHFLIERFKPYVETGAYRRR